MFNNSNRTTLLFHASYRKTKMCGLSYFEETVHEVRILRAALMYHVYVARSSPMR